MHSETLIATPAVETTSRRDMNIILTMLIATFVVILNETIMNVALPQLMTDLRVSASTAQWLATAYLLVMAILIPTTGFLIQRFTTRALFVTAVGLFAVGTLTAGSAPNFAVLLIGRIFQAAGTAVMLPLLTTAILALVPPERRGAMMGTVSIVISVAPAIGPTISGLIVETLSWRYLFFAVLPIALLVLAYGARTLVNIGEPEAAALDLPSVILAALGFGGIVYGFSSAGEQGGWSNPLVLAPIIVGGLALIVFTWRQLRLPAPLLDLRALRYPMFALSVALIMGVMIALFSSAILLPIYLQNVRRFTPLQTGLLLLPGGVLMGAVSPMIGRVFDRYGPRLLVTLGSSLLAGILALFTTITATTPVVALLAMHSAFNIGLALLFTPILTTGLNQLPRALYPHGSAISTTLQQVAGAIGTALLVTIMTNGTQAYARRVGSATATTQRDALTAGLHVAFAVATGVAVATLMMALFLRRSHPPVEEESAQGAPVAALY